MLLLYTILSQTAAKAIGNDALFDKLKSGKALIQRDIVFANSLYIVEGEG